MSAWRKLLVKAMRWATAATRVQLAIASKGQGKSGGARVITYVRVVGETVFLLAIYDKSEQDSITDQEVRTLLDKLEE